MSTRAAMKKTIARHTIWSTDRSVPLPNSISERSDRAGMRRYSSIAMGESPARRHCGT